MRYLTLGEVLELHRRVIEQSGGSPDIRDLGTVETALAQPRATFGGEDLYPTLVDKASAMAYALVMNHPFVDGNKRTGHAAMEVFLVLNGHEIEASVDEQEKIFLKVASGEMKREAFTEWLRSRFVHKNA